MPLTEKVIIQSIRSASYRPSLGGNPGIGDDCAVIRLPKGHEALVTTDFSLEDVHFRRAWHPADSVGHRCLARGLSDIAAMGGIPKAAFLSLALPPELPQRWITQFLRGLLRLADRYQVLLAGGDTAQSMGGILADIVVLGSVPAGKAVLRSGARPRDLIYVSGTLGSSVAALNELRDGKTLRPRSRLRHFYPDPRIALGKHLRERKLASAMIDISDGLSTDLGHICDESQTGAIVYAHSVPTAGGDRSLELALHGGEEYELLFTARPDRRVPREIAGVPISLIGEIVAGGQMKLAKPDGRTEVLKPGGWQHFK
jgi:thiamine-monophosphate kinase